MTRRAFPTLLLCLAPMALAPPVRGADEAQEARPPLRLLDFEIEDAAVRRVVEGYTLSRALEAVQGAAERAAAGDDVQSGKAEQPWRPRGHRDRRHT